MNTTVRRYSARRPYLFLAPVLLVAVNPGNTVSAPAGTNLAAARSRAAAYYCTNPQQVSTVQGNPHVVSVPSLESVGLVPKSGGLMVTFKFHKPFAPAPEGVYIAWSVFVFRHRSDAQNVNSGLQLQVEDRGRGWQPTGWTILASIGTADNLVEGQVHTNKAHDEFTTFFPGGFSNLNPPFYWFASQEEYRAYLPMGKNAATRDWNVYGAVFTDCPAGVRPDPYSSPYAGRLLTAPG
ncbi:MAG TPA: hypothetical protein VMF65_04825 [Acidimicrobiales bacterium]|nr:hypothetical protein [Acidimicrobiales bacterium]